MEITDIKIVKNNSILRESKVRAFVNLTIDGELAVNDVRIVSGSKGLFVAFPSVKHKNGSRSDIVFPVSNEFRQKLTDKIMEAYKAEEEKEKDA